ncbi:hypothetical protein Tco_1128428 [Tanacetum coccineum]
MLRNKVIKYQVNDTEPPNFTELCQLLRQISEKVDGLCLFKDFATAEFAKINAGEGTSNQRGNGGNNMTKLHTHQVGGNNNAEHHHNPYGKLTRLDFPKFNGEDFIKRFGENVPWNVYEYEILSRFGEVYDDPLVELKILKQTTDVESYQDKFEMILNKDVSCLAKMQEAIMALAKAKLQYSSYSSSRYQQSNVAPRTTTYPPKPPLLALPSAPRPGFANLCSGQLYALKVVANVVEGEEMVMDMSTEIVEEIREEEKFVDCPQTIEERPQISLNALSEVNAFKTMRIKAMAAARRMGCQLRRTVPLEVFVADGNQMVSEYMCKGFEWTIQGITYVIIIPLGSCDMVLGVQWLATLGDILWNYEKLTMEYKYKGKRVVLRGSQQAVLFWLNGKQSTKKVTNDRAELSVMFVCVYLRQLWHMSSNKSSLNNDIQEVLNDFKSVFEVPKELPPQRSHDLSIPLLPNTSPINIRPYRHPPNQKEALELMVKELIDSGTIKNRNSSFFSPIIMVKKKDGNWRMFVDYRKLNK